MAYLIYLAVIVIVVVLTAFSVGIGSSYSSTQALQAINLQPAAHADINKATLLGLALTETTAVLGIAIGLYLVFRPIPATAEQFYFSLAHLAIICALGIPGAIAGYASAFPVSAAAHAIARQPFTTSKIINLMLITVSFVQTPVILGFVIAWWAHMQAASCFTLPAALKIIAAGLAVGLGSIGPILGLAKFASGACQAIGLNRTAYSKVLSFTVISEALIETPFVFALIVAFIILQFNNATVTLLKSLAFLAAAIATGLGNIMPGIASGNTATAACLEIAMQPELYPHISKTSIIVQGFIDSFAIYGWLIALILVLL